METKTEKAPMSQKNKMMIAGALVVVLIVVIVMAISKPKTEKVVNNSNNTKTAGQQAQNSNPEGDIQQDMDILDGDEFTEEGELLVPQDKFREEVPQDIIVPDKETELTEVQKEEIAIPTVVTEAAPGVEAQFRSYDIKAEGGKFIPSTVIANSGDTVHINFTAIDKDYDIVFPSYNMKQTAKTGQTKILEFQALSSGSFTYYCDMCGGESSATKGKIIIK